MQWVYEMEEYLRLVEEQIRFKKAIPYIRQELKAHIEDQMQDNIRHGMDKEKALEEAVKEMGDPVETGVSLDHVHRPKVAWDLVLIILVISIMGIFLQSSGIYTVSVLAGLALMTVLYRLDYTFIIRHAGSIAIILTGLAVFLRIGHFYNSTVSALMLIYVPVYAAIVYQYRNSGSAGLIKAVAWTVAPLIIIAKTNCYDTVFVYCTSTLVVLITGIRNRWFKIQEKKAISGVSLAYAVELLVSEAYISYTASFGKGIYIFYTDPDNYMNHISTGLKTLMKSCKLIGKSDSRLTEMTTNLKYEYMLAYINSNYGLIVGALICVLLLVFAAGVFYAALNQKNQAAKAMGYSMGTILLMNMIINILMNFGLISVCSAPLTFFSAGTSYILMYYTMLGVVLSIYRYKNIYPIHLSIVRR